MNAAGELNALVTRTEEWQECHQCSGYGFTHHDCGEDTCCCLDPEDNVTCDVCMGMGGYYIEAVNRGIK